MKLKYLLFLVLENVQIANDPYEAAKDSHAIVICTEWDEFTVNLMKNFYCLDFI